MTLLPLQRWAISIFLSIGIIIGSFNPVFAEAKPDLFIDSDGFSTVSAYPVTNKKFRIYLPIVNSSLTQDMKGVVRAYNTTEKKQIEVEQSFSVLKNNKTNIFFDYTPTQKGVHELSFRIIPWEEYSDNQAITDTWSAKIFVDSDSDSDGHGDQIDAFPHDASKWQAEPIASPEAAAPVNAPSLPDDVFSVEHSRPPVVILSQMNSFSIRRGENFVINSGLSRGFLGENLSTKWEIINSKGEVIFEKNAPELQFAISWIGSYTIRATVTNESGISASKEIAFTVRFSWRDFFMAIGITGLLGCIIWWIWNRKKFT